MKKLSKVLAVLLATTFIATGCSGGGSTSKVDEIKKAGIITMYTNAEFPPYEFLDNNEIVGVDVEIGKAIAEKLGVKLDIVNAEFGGIVASIGTGKGDMALSGITINEERKKEVDFSVPYIDSVQYIILPENSDIKVMEDLEGKVIGGQTGTTGAMLVEDEITDGVLKDKKVEQKHYNSAPIAMQDLINGKIQAVVIDQYVAMSIAKENPGYEAIPFVYASGSPVTEQYGVAVNKNSKDLLEIIDEVVADMVSKNLIDQYIEQYSE